MPPFLLPLMSFAVATSITPGPNTIMVTASGANFGFWRTMPHMLGVGIGFSAMIMAIGLGLGQIFTLYPPLHTALKLIGTAYLLYLAWRIATAARPGKGEAAGRPFSFLQAALFQWVNPKAWMIAIGALSAFTTAGESYITDASLVAGTYLAIAFPCTALWCAFGVVIGKLLQSEFTLKIFNWTMAALIVASIGLLYLDPALPV